MYFASYIQVGELMLLPAKYYENNGKNTLHLLDAKCDSGAKRFFSSTAANFDDLNR